MGQLKGQRLDKEKDKREKINNFLDQSDGVEEVAVDRIHQTLLIDGETHPTRSQVASEVKKLHGRRRKTARKKSP